MTTEKLTVDICFKYPNAKIIGITDKEYFLSKDFIRVEYKNLLALLNQVTGLDVISDCKLQLRPESSLTDEEKVELQKVWLKSNSVNIKMDKYRDEFADGFREVKMPLGIIDYLRSINIDIDGLKERGIAEYEI